MEKRKSTKKRKPSPRVRATSVAATSAEAVMVSDAIVGAGAVHAAVVDAIAGGDAARDVDAPATIDASLESKVYLDPSLEIKDVEDAHRRLTATLARGAAVTVDMSRVGAVDTAGVQLLIAFQSEAVKRGVPVRFCGESVALTHALNVLGLRDAVQIPTGRD